jgi:putative transposase
MDERLRFVARLLDGLTDRSRRPYRHANRLPFQIEKLIVALKRERPSWGAPKIREKLRRP